ncbi:MAG: hypothetical protein WC208_15620 [Gallionella sp.]|jgi:hypothetical protein
MDEEVTKVIIDCFKAVQKGGQKSQYENDVFKVTAYKAGTIIRIDVKEKT